MQENDTFINNFRNAGGILKIVKDESRKLVTDGYKVIDLVEFIEKRVVEMGGFSCLSMQCFY